MEDEILNGTIRVQDYCDNVIGAIQQVVAIGQQSQSDTSEVITTLCFAYQMARQKQIF